ncbi:hypothetical protein N7519_010309 [Penicillium mononematosum]|uniref:uncharacterized protein n=1 Tax=Penicillium mononematosum TaxID=268346 RepID=UPI0025473064|nr:uncharacterized protein N7519_010309 [Penicillium mononematosum]KAJ6179848.1 hypothetical protein N7519_010309 [Penicillium mononematosum]
MAIAWVSDAIHDNWHWTNTITFFGVVLQTATGCRVGDMIRSGSYTGSEFVAWGDVDLRLRGPMHTPVTVEDLECVIRIRYVKGPKQDPPNFQLKRIGALRGEPALCCQAHPYGFNLQRQKRLAGAEDRFKGLVKNFDLMLAAAMQATRDSQVRTRSAPTA